MPTIILTNKHNEKNSDKQIESARQLSFQQYQFEREKIVDEKVYTNKVEIIQNILFIKSQNNLTKNYIMEISHANEFTANQKYEEIVNIANKIITNLYLSFPNLTDYGYKILGHCNMIWGNEQNYFGYQADKTDAQFDTKGKLITLYNELNDICDDCLNALK